MPSGDMGLESPWEIRKYSMIGWVLSVFFCISNECVQLETEPYNTLQECEINRAQVVNHLHQIDGITFYLNRCDRREI